MDVDFLKHKFEDGFDGIITKSGFKLGVRFIQVAYMILCSVSMGILRGSIGIGVLAIGDLTRENEPYAQIHNWDRRIQGTILSSFLFGYALSVLPAGIYLKNIAGKWIIALVLIMNGFLSLATPTIVDKGGWPALCNTLFLMGMSQACVCPANQSLLQQWLPPNERRILSHFVNGGLLFGIILSLPISALLSESWLGWQLVFYSQAMMMLSVTTIWVFLTSSSPDSHQAVGDSEKEFIRDARNLYKQKNLNVPWKRIIKSKAFWAITSGRVASNALFVYFMFDIPVYLQSCGITLKESTTISMLPFIVFSLVYIVTSPAVDWLYKLGYVTYIINLSNYRKLINTLAAVGIIIGLALIPTLAGSTQTIRPIVFLLAGAFGLLGFQYSGFLENIKDVSENFSGSILTLSDFVSSTVGALVPFLTGLLVASDEYDLQRWRSMFIILCMVYGVCNLAYLLLGSSDRADWDSDQIKKGFDNRLYEFSELEMNDIKQTKLSHEDINYDTPV